MSEPTIPVSAVREHELKTWPDYYAHLVDGSKTFEFRRDDRGFQVGDVLYLREWEPLFGRYTGREMRRVVTYMLNASKDFVVMALAAAQPPAECELFRPWLLRQIETCARRAVNDDRKRSREYHAATRILLQGILAEYDRREAAPGASEPQGWQPIEDLLAYGRDESNSARIGKDREAYQFYQGWVAALERVRELRKGEPQKASE